MSGTDSKIIYMKIQLSDNCVFHLGFQLVYESSASDDNVVQPSKLPESL